MVGLIQFEYLNRNSGFPIIKKFLKSGIQFNSFDNINAILRRIQFPLMMENISLSVKILMFIGSPVYGLKSGWNVQWPGHRAETTNK